MRLNKQLKAALDNQPRLTNDELNELIIQAKNGDAKAQNKIIESNLRLVCYYANELQSALKKIAVIDLDDLISEGVIGMSEAIQRFDIQKEIKFSYYAGFYIKKNMMATIMNDSKLIRIPQNKQTSIKKITEIIEKLFQENEGLIDESELTENKEYKEGYFNYYFNNINYVNLDDEDELFKMGGEDSNDYDNEYNQLKIKNVLKKLKPNQRHIIQHFFGLNGFERLTQTQIAERLGITKQRVNQLFTQGKDNLKQLLSKE